MQSYVFFASIGSDLAGMAKTTGEQFGFDWRYFSAQVLSFGIVATLLYFFVYKRVLAMLEERRQHIAESLENVEKIKAELAATKTRQREILAQANDQANKLIEETRAAAARVQAQETQRAVAVAEQIVAKAREATTQDHARMLTELKREVGRLVVQTTAAVTGKVLTPEDQRRLIEDANKQLGA